MHPYTDELAAYLAAQWASGFTQREVARTVLGQRYSAGVCIQIKRFLDRYTVLPTFICDNGEERSDAYGNDRRAYVKEALANFVAARDGLTNEFPRSVEAIIASRTADPREAVIAAMEADARASRQALADAREPPPAC